METTSQMNHPAVVAAIMRLNDVIQNLDTKTIEDAVTYAADAHKTQKRLSGEPYIVHPIEVARLVANVDGTTQMVIASLLHDTVEDTDITLEDVIRDFGTEIAELVDGCTKIVSIHPDTVTTNQAATLRKLFVALAADPRVIIIKLCDRLHNLRTIGGLSPVKAARMGRETLAIHAPIAHRIGLKALTYELEDRAFAAADPDGYRLISNLLGTNNTLHTQLEQAKMVLDEYLQQLGISHEIESRVKHLWSIQQKNIQPNFNPNDLPDLLGLRVICNNVDECYKIVEAVHKLWEPNLTRFKNYVDEPKFNSYQSLHTTVTGPNGRPIEIQIRTKEMHAAAERGTAAHHAYKNPKNEPDWVGRLLSWSGVETDDDYMQGIQHELKTRKEVAVLTPQSDVITFPEGASIIDFAYAVHSAVGNHCVKAVVDGVEVPLNMRLKNGQTVEIITGNRQTVPAEWLEWAVTGRARTKIRQQLARQNHPTGRPVPEPSTE